MKVKEFKGILLDMLQYIYEDDLDVDRVVFSPENCSGSYSLTLDYILHA